MMLHCLSPRRLKLVTVFICLTLGWAVPYVFGGSSVQDDSEGSNLVENPSFEKSDDGNPVGWRKNSWQGSGTCTLADVGRSGNRSARIDSEEGGDLAWSITVSVRPHATYRLSGWIKTQDVRPVDDRPGRGALLNLHNLQGVATPAVTGTEDWQRVEVVFETSTNDAIQINCLFGGWGLAIGTAWFDDLQLTLLEAEDWQPTVTIDAKETGHPISKYIYGQFIEHLGRCIYGGIWAEMLEDRKFYYPVTADYAPYGPPGEQRGDFPVLRASPWAITGADDSVTMVPQDSFVGEHTPRIEAGSGVTQHDLGVEKGERYSGYIWLKAVDGQAEVSVDLSHCEGKAAISCNNEQYTKHSFEFVALKSTDEAALSIDVGGSACFVGTVSLMPANHVRGLRADTLELLQQLDSPVYRWPGGNFVSGYDWKDGVGDRDRRPPRTNPAWTGVEHNDFGLDEFMTFCRLLDTEPYIAVNSGLGGVESAVEELQYANGSFDSPMGAWRARNGHPEPYAVKWWGIGNEMYGGWQLGHMPLEQYTKKHNLFAEAMSKEDPSIKLVAVGAVGRWSEGMMQNCADHMDLISEHFYCQERPGLASHVMQIPNAVRAKAEAHRQYRQRFDTLEGKDIDIALDEWNYWYGPHVYGELGTRYFLKDALGVAAGLNEYTRQSDMMFMANYAQAVNVIGCIKTTKTHAAFATTGLVLKLYRQQFGTQPVAVTTQSPLDVAAALTDDRQFLTIGIVNPTMQPLTLPVSIDGLQLEGSGTRWELAGADPMAYNEPGKSPQVTIEEKPVRDFGGSLDVAPCSVTLVRLQTKQ